MNFEIGDVLDYTSERENRWCREEIAIVKEAPGWTGLKVWAEDTYWSSGSDNHILTVEEMDGATLRFKLGAFIELDRYQKTAPQGWLDRAEEDRQTITSQHGLVRRWFIRGGSQPSVEMMRENLVDEMRRAGVALKSATSRFETAKWELLEFNRKHQR